VMGVPAGAPHPLATRERAMTDCFHCGDDDHLSYDCPNRTRRRTAPAPPQASGQAAEPGPASRLPGYGTPVPPRKLPGEIADYAAWARKTWESLGWPSGQIVRTPFREHARLPIRTDDELRAIATRQLAASRSARPQSEKRQAPHGPFGD
jgi:hypothetical protein